MVGKKNKIEVLDDDKIEELDTEINNDNVEKFYEEIEEDNTKEPEEDIFEEESYKEPEEDIFEEESYKEPEKDTFEEESYKEIEEDNIKDIVKEEIEREKKKESSSIFDNTKIVKFVISIVCGIILALACIKFFGGSDNNFGNSNYYLTDYNDNEYNYKIAKQLSIFDSIILRDLVENKDIRYDFKISNGKVIASNNYGTYELKTIENAKKLVVTPMGNLNEFTGLFVLTKDSKFYSVSLYDIKGNLIRNCDELENSIKSYDFSFTVNDFEAGFYSKNDGSNTEGIILITDTDKYKHVLTTKKNNK